MTSSDSISSINSVLDNPYCVNFLLSNARSLSPKIRSLIEAFQELKIDIAAITETWLKDGSALGGDLIDLEGGTGLKVIYKNRPKTPGGRTAGGGVAIIYNSSTCQLKERKIKKNKFEIICATGKIKKITRPVAVFAAYMPPRLLVAEVAAINEMLATELAAVSSSMKNPIIIFAGDLNGKCVLPGLQGGAVFLDMALTGPTRGDRTLDLCFTNVGDSVVTSRTIEPLISRDGTVSDHSCVHLEIQLERERNFTWVKKRIRKRTPEGDAAYLDAVSTVDWANTLKPTMSSDEMVDKLEEVLAHITQKHCPVVTSRRRSNEEGWITNQIRRQSKKKHRLFKRHGRGRVWREYRDKVRLKIKESRESFIDRMITDGNLGKSYYTAVKSLAGPGGRKHWAVGDIFPGASDEKIATEVLNFYSNIVEEDDPLLVNSPLQTQLPPVSVEDVTERLGAASKSNSMVPGDPVPDLVRASPSSFAVPATILFNRILRDASWPRKWKTENLTIIPKTSNPSTLNECRNISCTSFFSKVLEGVILDRIREEIPGDPNQFGGEKRCGAEHMLVDMWEEILSGMDQGDSAAVILSVDFEKAFNRMRHKSCIEALELLGASSDLIKIISSFLSGRQMRVRIGEFLSHTVPIWCGSPQGSVLGCILYCITTQAIAGAPGNPAPTQIEPPMRQAAIAVQTRERSPQGEARIGPGESPDFFGETSIRSSSDDSFFSATSATPPHSPGAIRDWPESGEVLTFKYIDDTSLLVVIRTEGSVKHFTTATTQEDIHAAVLGMSLRELVTNAEKIGMKINCGKTKLLCISPRNGCHTTASMEGPEGLLTSCDSLKLVGFAFDENPTVNAHYEHIRTSFRGRIWMLFHLRNSGLKGRRLFALYCCYVRSIIEYCSPVYHSMLGKVQEEGLERLHRLAIRICFGFDKDVEDSMREESIENLKTRRIRRTDGFIAKALGNPRFRRKWFGHRQDPGHDLRNPRRYDENRARTTRYLNAPLSYMKRRANELNL